MKGIESALKRIDKKALLIGLGLFLLAFGFRLWGVDWGLPNDDRWFSLHPDEWVILMSSQAVNPAAFDFTPGFYNYGTFYLTLLRITSDIVGAYGGGPEAETAQAVYQAYGRMHMGGRILSVIAGSGLVWVMFSTLRRWIHPVGAVIGALALAVTPGLVVHSRFQTVDVLAVFLLACSLWFTLRLFPKEGEDDPDWQKMVIWAGVFAGLSAGTKYTGILALLPLLIAVWLAVPKENRIKTGLVGIGAGLGAFLLSTPGILLESGSFWKDFKYEMTHTSTGHGLVFEGTSSGFVYHIFNIMQGYGVLLLVLGLAGLIWAAIKKDERIWCLLAFGLVYFLLIGRAEVKFLRYTFPLLPVLAAGLGWLVSEAHQKENHMWKLVGLMAIMALGGVFPGGLSNSVVLSNWMAGTDSRDEASAWLKENGAGKTVGLVTDPWFYSPGLYPEIGAPRPFNQAHVDNMSRQTSPSVVRYLPFDPSARKDWDVRLLDEANPDFVVFSSFEVDDLARLHNQGRRDGGLLDYEAFMKQLQATYENVAVYGVGGSTIHDMMYIRPRIWIWKRKEDFSTTSTGSSTTSPESVAPAITP